VQHRAVRLPLEHTSQYHSAVKQRRSPRPPLTLIAAGGEVDTGAADAARVSVTIGTKLASEDTAGSNSSFFRSPRASRRHVKTCCEQSC
jgi:hypothetical protein